MQNAVITTDLNRVRDFWLREAQLMKGEATASPARAKPAVVNVDCDYVVKGAYLTPQEYRCAESLLKGHTFKQVALELSLSPRTVEFYINNMKKKFAVKKKKALLELLAMVFSTAE